MRTKSMIDQRVKRQLLGWVVLLVLFVLVFIAAGCSAVSSSPTAPTTVAASTASTSPAAAPAAETPAVTPGPAVGADPVAPAENCAETDPRKWLGFSYSITVEDVTMRNSSACDRLVTWRAFVVITDSNQPPAGNALTVVVPAGAGFGAPGSRLERPWVLKLHYSGGAPPCGSTIQVDGRAGNVPNMLHVNASFTAGRVFNTPACAVVVTPPTNPPACVPGQWVKVSERDVTPGTATAPASSKQTFVCPKRTFEIVESNGCVTRTRREEREVCPQ